jgi:hypothetical protein
MMQLQPFAAPLATSQETFGQAAVGPANNAASGTDGAATDTSTALPSRTIISHDNTTGARATRPLFVNVTQHATDMEQAAPSYRHSFFATASNRTRRSTACFDMRAGTSCVARSPRTLAASTDSRTSSISSADSVFYGAASSSGAAPFLAPPHALGHPASQTFGQLAAEAMDRPSVKTGTVGTFNFLRDFSERFRSMPGTDTSSTPSSPTDPATSSSRGEYSEPASPLDRQTAFRRSHRRTRSMHSIPRSDVPPRETLGIHSDPGSPAPSTRAAQAKP